MSDELETSPKKVAVKKSSEEVLSTSGVLAEPELKPAQVVKTLKEEPTLGTSVPKSPVIVDDKNSELAKRIYGELILKEFEDFNENGAKAADVAAKIKRAADQTRRFVKGFTDHFGNI